MSPKSPITEKAYRRLLQEIEKHNRLYYKQHQPTITDYAYDRMVKEAEAIEREHPEWVQEDAPTATVGDDQRKGFKTVAHSSPMLSLTNTYSESEGDYW